MKKNQESYIRRGYSRRRASGQTYSWSLTLICDLLLLLHKVHVNLSSCVTCSNIEQLVNPHKSAQPSKTSAQIRRLAKKQDTRTGQNKATCFTFCWHHVVAVGPTRLATRLPRSTHHQQLENSHLSFQHTSHLIPRGGQSRIWNPNWAS
jgi:hypothetical protein